MKEWPLLFCATEVKINQLYGEFIAKIRYNTPKQMIKICSKLYVVSSLLCEFFNKKIKNCITNQNWEKI